MFWRGVLGYLPVNVVQGVVGLLTIVLFTRVLTPEPSTASTPWPSRSAA
jgi:O-antigen/teichoic acid export membrane protein